MLKRKNVHRNKYVNAPDEYVVGIWSPAINDFEPLTPDQKIILSNNQTLTRRNEMRVFKNKNSAIRMARKAWGYSCTCINSILDIRS